MDLQGIYSHKPIFSHSSVNSWLRTAQFLPKWGKFPLYSLFFRPPVGIFLPLSYPFGQCADKDNLSYNYNRL